MFFYFVVSRITYIIIYNTVEFSCLKFCDYKLGPQM